MAIMQVGVMKIAAMVAAPDLAQQTLAMYSGDLPSAFARLGRLGYDAVELMTRDPWSLPGHHLRRWLEDGHLSLAGLCAGHVYGEDRLGLVRPDLANCQQAMARLKRFMDFVEAHLPTDTFVNIGHVRGPGYPGDPVRTITRATDAFQELADYAAAHASSLSPSTRFRPRGSRRRKMAWKWSGRSGTRALA